MNLRDEARRSMAALPSGGFAKLDALLDWLDINAERIAQETGLNPWGLARRCNHILEVVDALREDI